MCFGTTFEFGSYASWFLKPILRMRHHGGRVLMNPATNLRARGPRESGEEALTCKEAVAGGGKV